MSKNIGHDAQIDTRRCPIANEITVSVSLSILKSGSGLDIKRSASGQFDLTGTEYIHNIASIGTSEEALAMGDVAAPGWCYMKNLDPTNYIEIRAATGVADSLRLNAGEFCVFRFAADATAPYAAANTAACRLEYLIVEA